MRVSETIPKFSLSAKNVGQARVKKLGGRAVFAAALRSLLGDGKQQNGLAVCDRESVGSMTRCLFYPK
jgi:hypothetical protein